MKTFLNTYFPSAIPILHSFLHYYLEVELPLKWQSVYLVPYTGVTISDSLVDIDFKDSDNAPGHDFSVFDASNDKICGFLFGCDIMPSLTSSFIYNFELKLVVISGKVVIQLWQHLIHHMTLVWH